jgi:formylmethanofuran:tetrahydromethanopterin formyltransferase
VKDAHDDLDENQGSSARRTGSTERAQASEEGVARSASPKDRPTGRPIQVLPPLLHAVKDAHDDLDENQGSSARRTGSTERAQASEEGVARSASPKDRPPGRPIQVLPPLLHAVKDAHDDLDENQGCSPRRTGSTERAQASEEGVARSASPKDRPPGRPIQVLPPAIAMRSLPRRSATREGGLDLKVKQGAIFCSNSAPHIVEGHSRSGV